MNWIPTLHGSNDDAIDLFAGFGGWSTAAGLNGLVVKRALNHWDHAIKVHWSNHPYTSHYLGDVKDTKPSEHPRTRIFLGSPCCTDFSQAKVKLSKPENDGQLSFPEMEEMDDREYEKLIAERQRRATMWDVIEFTAHHRYQIGIIENVVEVHKWSMFEQWCKDLGNLGYDYRMLYLNSQFFHPLNGVDCVPPAPQSRDRWYCVFWRKGTPAPDLDFRPLAPCPNCGDIRAVQVWKNPQKRWGKYGLANQQYYYGCPNCWETHQGRVRPLPLDPYYYAAINCIDLSIPIRKVKDFPRGISPRTRARIQAGLDKYGGHPLSLSMYCDSAVNKYRSALLDPMYTLTGSVVHGMAIPGFLLDNRNGIPRVLADPLQTLTTTNGRMIGLGVPPLITNSFRDGNSQQVRSALDPLFTQSGTNTQGVVLPMVVDLGYTHAQHEGKVRQIMDAMPTVTTADTQGLVIPPSFLIELYGNGGARSVVDPVNTVTAGGGKSGLCVPFISTYNGHSVLSSLDEALTTVTTKQRHGLSVPEDLSVDECYYRTLRPIHTHKGAGPNGTDVVVSELRSAMGFPQDYHFFGKTEEITRGFGAAITPGAGYWIINQAKQVLD